MEKNPSEEPILRISSGGIEAAVWLNSIETKNGPRERHLIRITKSYWDKEIKEQVRTETLFLNDLHDVITVATEVFRRLRLTSSTPDRPINGIGTTKSSK